MMNGAAATEQAQRCPLHTFPFPFFGLSTPGSTQTETPPNPTDPLQISQGLSKNKHSEASMIVHTYKPSTHEPKAGGLLNFRSAWATEF